MDTALYFYRKLHDEGSIWKEESSSFHTGTSSVPFQSAAVSVCVFQDGAHVVEGYDCPHRYNGSADEYEPGWTVLKNRK